LSNSCESIIEYIVQKIKQKLEEKLKENHKNQKRKPKSIVRMCTEKLEKSGKRKPEIKEIWCYKYMMRCDYGAKKDVNLFEHIVDMSNLVICCFCWWIEYGSTEKKC